MKIEDLDLDKFEDKSKEEILTELRKTQKQRKIDQIDSDYDTSFLLDLMVENFDDLEESDCSDFTLKKEGLIKILMDKGVF